MRSEVEALVEQVRRSGGNVVDLLSLLMFAFATWIVILLARPSGQTMSIWRRSGSTTPGVPKMLFIFCWRIQQYK